MPVLSPRILFLLALLVSPNMESQWHHFGEVGSTPGRSILQTEMLQAHNAVRERYGVEALRWSPMLAKAAQSWAVQLLSDRSFRHEQHLRWGQNLYDSIGGTRPPGASDVVAAWASEAVHYNKRSNSCNAVCGHFTQIVWRETAEVGCGRAQDGHRSVWVCDYSPPGNVIGERPF